MAITCLADAHGARFAAYHGDCVDVLAQFPDASVAVSLYSPPFSNLYVYSDSVADMGNSATDAEFSTQYAFLVKELCRLTMPGRLSLVHCSDLPYQKWKDGFVGIKDLSGEIVRVHEAAGWVLHSRVTIWKSPVVEMTRTKALGLLHKQLLKDSCRSRVGMPDYLLAFRKDGDNAAPVTHTTTGFPVAQWQEWASPVWMTIDQGNVLDVRAGREAKDEKHLCPLQLDVIRRALTLWSNPGDTVVSPFMGIGSEGVCALQLGRRFVGVELKGSYFAQAVRALQAEDAQSGLFERQTLGASR